MSCSYKILDIVGHNLCPFWIVIILGDVVSESHSSVLSDFWEIQQLNYTDCHKLRIWYWGCWPKCCVQTGNKLHEILKRKINYFKMMVGMKRNNLNRSWHSGTPDTESHSRPLKLEWLPMWVWEQETQGSIHGTERERIGIHFLNYVTWAGRLISSLGICAWCSILSCRFTFK